jgi:methyl-accepting chemotaxis protein
MKQRRKVLIVDKKLQYKIISLIVAFGVVVSLISLLALQVLSSKIFNMLGDYDLSSDLKLQIIGELNNVTIILIVLMTASLAASWLMGLYFSNKIAGPIYNIMSTLDRYQSGDKAARVLVRENDHFEDLAKKVNAVLDGK